MKLPAFRAWFKWEFRPFVKQNWFKLAVVILWSATIYIAAEIQGGLESISNYLYYQNNVSFELSDINATLSKMEMETNLTLSEVENDIEDIARWEGVTLTPVPIVPWTNQEGAVLDKAFGHLRPTSPMVNQPPR